MAVKSLNELRRQACTELEDELCSVAMPKTSHSNFNQDIAFEKNKSATDDISNRLSALVSTDKQLIAVNKAEFIDTIYVNADIFLYGNDIDKLLANDKTYALVLPHIFRKRSYKYCSQYEKLLNSGRFKGVLVRNFEELEWLYEIGYNGQVYSDYTVYAWNNTAISLYEKWFDRITMPIELNRKELGFIKSGGNTSFVLYGYLPLMYSANCIQNTLEGCINDLSGNTHIYKLTDRYKNVFSIEQNCLHCYNILYNTVPLSLHGQLDTLLKKGYGELRLDFSMESEAQTFELVDFYSSLIYEGENSGDIPSILKDFTNGHYKRGVE
jgi:putative protease